MTSERKGGGVVNKTSNFLINSAVFSDKERAKKSQYVLDIIYGSPTKGGSEARAWNEWMMRPSTLMDGARRRGGRGKRARLPFQTSQPRGSSNCTEHDPRNENLGYQRAMN